MKIRKLKKAELEVRVNDFVNILKNELNEYWGKEHFLKDLEGKWKYSLYIEDKQKIIGYIIASKKDDNIHIHKFMIHNEYRSHGVGYKLLEAFENLCARNKEYLIELKVYNKNRLAIKFYLKNGFKEEENSEGGLLTMYKEIR